MAPLSIEAIQARLLERFGPEVVSEVKPAKDPFVLIAPARIQEVARALRDELDLAFDFLEDLTATDWPKENLLRVVVHLWSYRHRHAFKFKCELDRKDPKMPTLEGIWKAANWLEREVYDLFGIRFEGHSDLRRIMLTEAWDQRPLESRHPLRKDYVEMPEVEGISVYRENPLDLYLAMDRKQRPPEPPKPPSDGGAGAAEPKGAEPAEA